ncbi:hypothetical protein P8452_49394 [Trifolium repens]|jgi:lysine-specific demethylase 3|nr:hypothetical protein P8452_49394 [Trifolium repens]
MDNLKLCKIHCLQGKHSQYRKKVPKSLKLQRKRKNNDEVIETIVIDNAKINYGTERVENGVEEEGETHREFRIGYFN